MSLEGRDTPPPIPQPDRPNPDQTEIDLPLEETIKLTEADFEPLEETITLTEADLEPPEKTPNPTKKTTLPTPPDFLAHDNTMLRHSEPEIPIYIDRSETTMTLSEEDLEPLEDNDRTEASPAPEMTQVMSQEELLKIAQASNEAPSQPPSLQSNLKQERSEIETGYDLPKKRPQRIPQTFIQNRPPEQISKTFTQDQPAGLAETRVSSPEYEEINIEVDSKKVERLNFGLQFDLALESLKEFSKREYPTTEEKKENYRRKFNRQVAKLVTNIESDPSASQRIEDLLQHEERLHEYERFKQGTPFLVKGEGKRLFAAVGLKLFERDPYGFAEKFGYGHQMFTPRAERIKIATRLVNKEPIGPGNSAEQLVEMDVLLPEEVAGILYNLKGLAKMELAIKIKSAQEGDPLWETKESLEKVKHYTKLRKDLSKAIQVEMPELALANETSLKQEEKLSQKITKTVPVGHGVTAPLVAQTKDKVHGVYKPNLHEPGNARGDGTGGHHFRISQRKGDTVGSEVLVSLVGQLCGLRRSLPTPYVNGPIGPGTIQRLINGETLASSNDWIDGSGDIASDYQADFEDIAALDALTIGSDRHSNNMIINRKLRAVWPIDNGLNYVEENVPIEEIADSIADRMDWSELIGIPFNEMDELDRQKIEKAYAYMTPDNDVISVPVAFFENKSMSQGLHQRLSRLQEILEKEDGEVHRVLLETHKLFFGEKKGQRLFDRLKNRLNSMVTAKIFPENSPIFERRMGENLRQKIKMRKNQLPGNKGPSLPPPLPGAKRSVKPPPLPNRLAAND